MRAKKFLSFLHESFKVRFLEMKRQQVTQNLQTGIEKALYCQLDGQAHHRFHCVLVDERLAVWHMDGQVLWIRFWHDEQMRTLNWVKKSYVPVQLRCSCTPICLRSWKKPCKRSWYLLCATKTMTWVLHEVIAVVQSWLWCCEIIARRQLEWGASKMRCRLLSFTRPREGILNKSKSVMMVCSAIKAYALRCSRSCCGTERC